MISTISPDMTPSPTYEAGYGAGCDSGYSAAGHAYYKFKQDTVRYNRDSRYQKGWNDGFRTCKDQYERAKR